MENTNQLIGCCGLDCETCDARIATLTNDNTLREKTAALWTELNGVPITAEMINSPVAEWKAQKPHSATSSVPYITVSVKRD